MEETSHLLIIIKSLAGTATPEEQKWLADWIQSSADNQQVYDQMTRTWALSDRYDPSLEIDVEAAFIRMDQRLHADEKGTLIPLRSTRHKWWLAAAAVAVLMAIGVWMMIFSTHESKWITLRTNQGEIRTFTLPDQSRIVLNERSTLSYPTDFGQSDRPTRLIGEAFFDIKRDVNRPFSIEAGHTLTTVLGTAFNIRAYADENLAKVTVKNGKVRVQSDQINQSIQLEALQSVQYDAQATAFLLGEDVKLQSLDWMDETLTFSGTPVASVIDQLEEKYHVDIVLENNEMGNCLFAAVFRHPQIQDILHSLKTTFQFDIREEGDRIRLAGGKCR